MFLVLESHVNETEHYSMGDVGPYLPHTNNIGELFSSLQREFGRCISKVYLDTNEGTFQIGWAFARKDKYEDTGEPFDHVTWVTLHRRIIHSTVWDVEHDDPEKPEYRKESTHYYLDKLEPVAVGE